MKQLALVLLACTGCFDATVSDFASVSKPHHIRCYSGGLVVYDAHSTGKVLTAAGGCYEFEDARDRTYVSVNMDCVITVNP